MNFASSKLAGLLAVIGTVAGIVLGGMTLKNNLLLAAAFFIVAVVSFITFVIFLYNFIMYAQYEMPYEDFMEFDEKEEP